MPYIPMMFTLKQQQQRYEQIWQKNAPMYGTQIMLDDPEPIYAIGFTVTSTIKETISSVVDSLSTVTTNSTGWVPIDELHVTIHLPGRLGVHFVESDIKNIVNNLRHICANTPAFTVQLGSLNVFPNVLFREVYDTSAILYNLHRAIVDKIAFAESPEFISQNFMPHMSIQYVKQTGSQLVSHHNFSRYLPLQPMLVEELYFTKCYDFEANKEIARIKLS